MMRMMFSGPVEGKGTNFSDEFVAIKIVLDLSIKGELIGKASLIVESNTKMVLN